MNDTLYFTWTHKNCIAHGIMQKGSNVKLLVLLPNAFVITCINTIRLSMEKSNAEKQDANVGIFTTSPFMVPKILDARVSTLINSMTLIKRHVKLVLAKVSHLIGHAHAE